MLTMATTGKKLISLEIGLSTKGLLLKLTQNDNNIFLLNGCSALIETVNYLKSNLLFCDQFFKNLVIFQPSITLDGSKCNSVHAITRIALYLNFLNNVIDSVSVSIFL